MREEGGKVNDKSVDDAGSEPEVIGVERGPDMCGLLGSELLMLGMLSAGGRMAVKGSTRLFLFSAQGFSRSAAVSDLLCCRRRRSQTRRPSIIAIKTSPPRTPPTIAPTGDCLELPVLAGAEVIGGEGDEVGELDLAEPFDADETLPGGEEVGVPARISKVGESARKMPLVCVARTTYCFPGGSGGI